MIKKSQGFFFAENYKDLNESRFLAVFNILNYRVGGEAGLVVGLKDWEIVIAGGDAREIVLALELEKKGAKIYLAGFEKYVIPSRPNISTGLPGRADAVICPLAGINANGEIYAPFSDGKLTIESIRLPISAGTIFLCGAIPDELRNDLNGAGVSVVKTGNLDELCIYNAIPTAEGAIGIALRESPITIYGSKALVLGFGRCAAPLSRALLGLGAEVTVAARRREVLAQAYSLGFRTLELPRLAGYLSKFNFIFNTVPALVLDEELLRKVKRDVLIVDIASAPGGTDFNAADKLGIKSILAPGLPGKTAPVTSGKILAQVYPHLLTLHRKEA